MSFGSGGGVWQSFNFPALYNANTPLPVQDYTVLRSITAQDIRLVFVTGSYASLLPQGISGYFVRDDNDVITADDNGTVVVSVNGKRWKRIFEFREGILVDWFGAKGDGVTDDTVAVRAAIARALALRAATAGMANSYTAPVVQFRSGGRYYCPGGLFALNDGLRIYGNGATIQSSPAYPFDTAVDLFTNVSFDCHIESLNLFGYNNVISIATANLDSALIRLTDLKVQEWAGYAIQSDATSQSTQLTIDNSKFFARSVNAKVLLNQCDVCNFDKNWVEGPCDLFFVNKKGLNITEMLGVPFASTPASKWIQNDGQHLRIDHSRFGGEPGSRLLVEQNVGSGGTNSTELIIENNELYSTGFPLVDFKEIPNIFVFQKNGGINGSLPLKFNAAIPAEATQTFGSRNVWNVDSNFHNLGFIDGQISNAENQVAAIKAAVQQTLRKELGHKTLRYEDFVRNILATEVGFGYTSGATAGLAGGVGVDMFGAATETLTGTNAANSSFFKQWATLLNGLPAGTYTLLANFEVTGGIVQVAPYIANQYRVENLGPGQYTIPVVCYFDGLVANEVAGFYLRNIAAGVTVAYNGLRVLSGRHDSYKEWNSVFTAVAAPAAGFWRAGDYGTQRVKAVGAPKAWACTVAGTPGIWVSEGNL